MTVKIGNIIDGHKTYVVGAPRSKEVGQVLLLQQEGDYLMVKLTLNGEQFGSGFGYDIALGDFNNDTLVIIRLLFQCFDAVGWVTGRVIPACKKYGHNSVPDSVAHQYIMYLIGLLTQLSQCIEVTDAHLRVKIRAVELTR